MEGPRTKAHVSFQDGIEPKACAWLIDRLTDQENLRCYEIDTEPKMAAICVVSERSEGSRGEEMI